MRALMLWRATTDVDLDAEGERDGVQWRWATVANSMPDRIRARTQANAIVLLFCYQAKDPAGNRYTAYVEQGLDPVAALGAWEAGTRRSA